MYKILLVNDQQLLRETLTSIIDEQGGFSVASECSSYREAIDICKKTSIDIIFIDLLISMEDKLEIREKIRLIDKNIKIFFIAYYNNFLSFNRALKTENFIDISEIILRPIEKNKVIKALDSYKKESKKMEDIMLDDIYRVLKNDDFTKAYEFTPHICRWLREEKEKGTDVKEKMYYLGNHIINSHSLLANEKKVEDIFPINEKHLFEGNLYCIWFFDVFDYYFREKSMINYPILESVLDYIDQEIHENISLKDVVENCSVSQGYISRLFKTEYNLTVLNYIHLKKINKAKAMFLSYDLPISDVALDLGYKESSYFCKVFKKYEDMTVEEFKLVNEIR